MPALGEMGVADGGVMNDALFESVLLFQVLLPKMCVLQHVSTSIITVVHPMIRLCFNQDHAQSTEGIRLTRLARQQR